MRIKFPESRRNWHDIYRDPMEERLFCFNNGPSGDEPDGVTFTSGDDYTPGQGIQISSSTLGPDSTEDTYRGLNTSAAALEPFGGAGASIDDITSGRTNARGESLFTSGVTDQAEFTGVPSVAAPGALANLSFDPNQGFGEFDEIDFGGTGPRPQVNLRVKPSNELMTVFPGVLGNSIYQGSRGRNESIDRNVALTALQDRAVAGDLSAQKELDDLGRQGAITFAEASYPQIQQQKALDATGITRAQDATAQNVLGSGISTLDTTDDARAQATGGVNITGPTSRPQMQGPPQMPDQIFDIDTRPDIVKDQQLADQIMASSQGVDRDSEVVSALSDDFLDERGRQDVNVLGKQIAEYFDNPIVEAGQFAEGLFKSKNDMGGMSRPDSLFTDKAGLPSFGSLGDMTKAVQAGGRLTTDESGNPLFVTMPDGSTIAKPTFIMTGGDGGGGSATAQKSPTDPCPAGYKMVDGVCQPTGEEEGGGFQTGSGVGDTRFSPFYTPQQVGDISPFVLQPYRNES